jgi:tetratricopeptide (TPR) repeat protein
LKPEDPFIHKYAGHLLFENGAFEDSILAYAHGEALPDRDMDIFLTRGKAYFLLGEFGKAYEDMLKVADQTHNEQNQVDLATIKALWEMKEVQLIR